MVQTNAAQDLDARLYPTYKLLVAVRVAAMNGVPPQSALEGTHLTEDRLEQSDTRISLREFTCVCRNIKKFCPKDDVSYQIGTALQPMQFGAYGIGFCASKTLGEALNFYIDYQDILTPSVLVSMSSSPHDRTIKLIFSDTLKDQYLHRFNIEMHTVMCLSFIKKCIDIPLQFSEAHFSFPSSDKECEKTNKIAKRTTYDADQDELVFPQAWVEKRFVESNPITAEVMQRCCARSVARLRKSRTISAQLLRAMENDLSSLLTIEQAATSLQLSPRTLRRYLAEEETSFSQLLSEFRLRRALLLIRDEHRSADEVAYELGYSDTPNFRAAFKRWTGQTISEYLTLVRSSPIGEDETR